MPHGRESGCDPPSVAYVGHATLSIDMDETRILTDPVLRNRLAHLYRHATSPEPNLFEDPDGILISHLHLDHLDLPSLRRLGKDRHLIVPFGAGSLLRRRGFSSVEELKPGESTTVGSLHITATQAAHSGFRPPFGPRGVPVGFIVAGSARVYFAGDTDIFPEMAQLAGGIDVALIPVWGWGPTLGPGHLNPESAAQALSLLQPGLAIPIHWGTLSARGMRKRDESSLIDPPREFAGFAARSAPQVTVKILQPGQCTTIRL